MGGAFECGGGVARGSAQGREGEVAPFHSPRRAVARTADCGLAQFFTNVGDNVTVHTRCSLLLI
jgi:hypothetical protein